MRLLDFLTSTRRPAPGTTALPQEEVVEKLFSLNRPTSPWRIIDGQPESVDLIAEWKILDAQWYQLFAKAGRTKVFRIFFNLDDEKRQVRSQDREYTVSWRAGVPKLSLAVSGFKGQKQELEFGRAFVYTETLEPGQVYNYRFDTREIKRPIQEAVTACGWAYKGVAFGRL